jgi:hypothetical protein
MRAAATHPMSAACRGRIACEVAQIHDKRVTDKRRTARARSVDKDQIQISDARAEPRITHCDCAGASSQTSARLKETYANASSAHSQSKLTRGQAA